MAEGPGDAALAATGFGGLLRACRERGLLSQERLAQRSGLSARSTIRDLEAGRVRRPRGASVRLLVDALRLEGTLRAAFEAAARDGNLAVWAGLPPGAAPCQLPPDLVDFTGRTELVCWLRQLLARPPDATAGGSDVGAVVVSAVAGKAGVGKSALAVHVAHQLAVEFPDGQLYANLRGARRQPLHPGGMLGWFLRALGVDGAAIPAGMEERAALYRSSLAGRRVLVVLDDAGSEAQVRPLLPGSPTCAVLVTSRACLAGLEGARLLDLDVLDPAQAVTLLGRMVGQGRVDAEPEAAAQLARRCGYLPLALRVAGARLAARPHGRLAELVERLADERQRLDELAYGQVAVRASLSLSYRALEPAAQRLFGRLGLLHADDVAGWVAAAVLDSPVERATELADRLVDARLLEVAGRDATGQVRYRFHDLVRVYARLGSPLLEPIYGSAARWPVDQAVTEALLADPLAFLEAERAGLVAAVTQAASLGMAGQAWELTSACTQFLAARLHLEEWRRCTGQTLAAARRAQDARGEAAVLLSLGYLHAISNRIGEALGCWQAALAILERLGEDTGRAMCLAALALHRSDRGAFEQRRRQAEDALAILAQSGDGSLRARVCVLHCLGLLYHNHGRVGPARRCFEEALRLQRGLGSSLGEARLLGRLGAVLVKQGRDHDAVSVLEQALAVLRPAGDRLVGTPAKVCLGTALVHLGHHAEARPLLEPWMDSGFPYVRAWALRGLGELDGARGRHTRARARLRESLRLFCQLDIPAEETVTRRALAALGERHHAHGRAHSKAHASLPPMA